MMTSIHMNQSESQTPTSSNLNGGLNQSQSSPSKYDEAERVRQRMDELRRHHAETVEIHHRTQPMIDDQIHEDTLKYLKTGPVNGTKARSQKPRQPKRQRSTASNSTSANHNSATPNLSNNNNSLNQFQVQTTARTITSNNGLQHHTISPPHLQQQQQPPQQQHQRNNASLLPQQRHIIQQQNASQTQQMTMPMGMQPVQHVQAFSPNMQQSIQVQSQQPHQMHQPQSYNDNYHNRYQAQPVYQQQPPPHQQQSQQQMQLVSHGTPHNHGMEQNHHHYMHSNTYSQPNHQSFYTSQQMVNNNVDLHYTTLPTDLDLNIQAGLECDIESLIKHEMSVEGQLDFNPDLLVKLDNYYHPNYQ